MFRRIAIVGGGAAAATVLGELLEHPTAAALHLDWYTGGNASARGVAYSTTSPHHLLNVRAASMGMFGGRSRGFLDFVQRDDPRISGTDFLPRSRYGDYLDAEVARVLAYGAARGHDVNIIPLTVDALVPEREAITVLCGEEGRRVDAAILALGALPARPLPGVSAAALASRRYVLDPWSLLAQRDDASPPRTVAVIGMGLTAVDVLLELSARWPHTRFTAISRHGHLPQMHLPSAAVPPGDSSELIKAMGNAPEIRHWMRLLREAIAEDGPWRAIIDSLRPMTPRLWSLLPLEQRARFLRHARSTWDRVRHRMPAQAGQALAVLEREGRLQRRCGRVQSVDVLDNALQLTLCHAGASASIRAELVIQATGLNTQIAHTDHRLVSQLLTNAHVTADPLGLGLSSDTDGRLLHDREVWPHLFAIGSLLRGTLWESTAMPEIRQQARHIAQQLLGE